MSENKLLDHMLIISCALRMARNTPLQELSIVRVARELGVTPALIHYYMAGREALTSGVMNAFYAEMLSDWPQMSGKWREDIEAAVRQVYRVLASYPGIAAYVIAYNRFRLKQIVAEGETDHGVLVFERLAAVVRTAGFDSRHTAMWLHLLMDFVVSMAYSSVRHRFPGEHGEHLDSIFASLDPREFPNTDFLRHDYVRLNADEAFTEALPLMLNGIEQQRPRKKKSTK